MGLMPPIHDRYPNMVFWPLPKWAIGGFAFFLAVVIAVINFSLGTGVALSFFYLIPITILSWFVGFSVGFICAVLSAVAWMIADSNGSENVGLTIWNSTMRLGTFTLISYLFSKLKLLNEMEATLARTDPLTGCGNRRAFYEALDIEIMRSIRYDRTLTVAYIDVDNFKSINDTYGHAMGDMILAELGKFLQSNVRKTDILARIGGDEFVIALPETKYNEAHMFLDRLFHSMNDFASRNEWTITFSIGAVSKERPLSVDSLLKDADRVMYLAKERGKNRLVHQEIKEFESKLIVRDEMNF